MRTLHNSECSVSSRYWLSRVALTDASFCSLLNDDCLAAATAACPSIKLLVLMSCTSVGLEGLLALRRLSNLTLFDMSYLQPIIADCRLNVGLWIWYILLQILGFFHDWVAKVFYAHEVFFLWILAKSHSYAVALFLISLQHYYKKMHPFFYHYYLQTSGTPNRVYKLPVSTSQYQQYQSVPVSTSISYRSIRKTRAATIFVPDLTSKDNSTARLAWQWR